ncbi:hypothetical protein FJ414_21535 [Mesorhizobium sp. B3-1-6]|uniref:hypothetical protein n=1 Tax=Mesorhizobium sp. B3-1-6 TaxID=2589895 RepID=UPI00112C8A45|nr:hypothetical protein [Mesorhizobium sp. B3-1-6]TPI32648.1 hypothetical protein FJ414_21535 [Mesorhizobium sp. B3-1-6]
MSEAMTTSNHEVIRAWIEAREGRPAIVAAPGKAAMLRVDFGGGDEDLKPIEWEDFFKVLDDDNLMFVHQDMTSEGSTSRFNKFVPRE